MARAKQAAQGGPAIGGALGKQDFAVDVADYDLRTQHDGYKPSAIGAKAYAAGEDPKIGFKGNAAPTQGLIGHEAAHVVQQSAGAHKA